jgi:hypothetical protein
VAINPISARLIYLEDLSTTTSPTGATASVNVLNAATNPQTLHKIPVVLLTQFTVAANDGAAAAAGVAVGQVYVTSLGVLHTRMT